MLRSRLIEIGNKYLSAKSDPFEGHELGELFRNVIPSEITQSLELSNSNLKVRGSSGQGRWADVPWIAITHNLVTSTILDGYYIVYLFSADMNEVYLCLGQGVTSIKEEFKKDWRIILAQRNGIIRARIPEFLKVFNTDDFDLHGDTKRAISYKFSTAFNKKYSLSHLPEEKILQEDLRLIIRLYELLVYRGGVDVIEDISPEASLTERKRERLHKQFEGRIDTRKVKAKHGYKCQVCQFNFVDKYGELGKDFIEAHHLIPYANLEIGQTRKVNIDRDFAVLCSNCHRMIHRTKDVHDVQAFKKLLEL